VERVIEVLAQHVVPENSERGIRFVNRFDASAFLAGCTSCIELAALVAFLGSPPEWGTNLRLPNRTAIYAHYIVYNIGLSHYSYLLWLLADCRDEPPLDGNFAGIDLVPLNKLVEILEGDGVSPNVAVMDSDESCPSREMS
jgi:hypothetical protein